jgi:hypothetical protein
MHRDAEFAQTSRVGHEQASVGMTTQRDSGSGLRTSRRYGEGRLSTGALRERNRRAKLPHPHRARTLGLRSGQVRHPNIQCVPASRLCRGKFRPPLQNRERARRAVPLRQRKRQIPARDIIRAAPVKRTGMPSTHKHQKPSGFPDTRRRGAQSAKDLSYMTGVGGQARHSKSGGNRNEKRNRSTEGTERKQRT